MKTYPYLKDYPQTDKMDLDSLLQSSINNLPFTLSAPVEKFTQHVNKEDYGRAMNCAIDFFEISVQYLSCMLIALIQKKEDEDAIIVKHKELIRAINKIDTKRPLSFGDWVNDIFFPLLKAAVERLPVDPLVICLNKNMFISGGNLLTGSKKEPSIVQIRNEYKGHGATLSEEIYKGVVYTLEPRIFSMLKAVSPLQEWTFFSCREQVAANRFKINLLNGYDLNKERIFETSQTLEPLHYYVCQGHLESENQMFVDIFPMIFSNEKNYVYVFQTLKDEDISYISSNENAGAFKSDCWNEALDGRLQRTLPSFDVAKELNCNEIKMLAGKASGNFLKQAYKEKKYNQELFVDRSQLSEYFKDFQGSDKNLFPMLGEAGQGKTNQLCYWTEILIERKTGVIIFNSSGFSEHTLEEKIKDIFGYSERKPVKKLLDNIHKKLADNHEKIYFFFDAINECLSYKESDNNTEGPLNLYRDIHSLLINKDYPNFKVLFTCRSYTWKNLIQPQIPKEDHFVFHTKEKEEVAVRGFSIHELEKAYYIYRELYQMKTPFSSLAKSSTIRLKDPLVLKIACTNFLGMELPTDMLSYTSISLFEKMLQDISRSYAGNKQCSILKELARYILQEYEKGIPADSISAEILRQAYNDEDSQLHEMAKLVYKKKDDISVAYGELLNKPERPVLRLTEKDDGTGQLQFIYERFLEFMLASVFIERERNKTSGEKENISAETFVHALQRSNTNVVFMGAMRNALIMDYMHTRNLSVLLDLIGKYGDNPEVMLLITETLNVLIRENYETEIFAFIKQLLCQQPDGGETLIQNFNAVQKKIESNQADDRVISEHNRLSNLLATVIRLRKLASVSVVNGLFLTDYFNEGLYRDNPFHLLWMLLSDPINEVRNDACMYVYYLSNKTHTLEYSLLKENLTQRIINEMYSYIRSNSLLKIAFLKQRRNLSVIFLETATLLNFLLIIDAMLTENEYGKKQVGIMLNETNLVLKHITVNYNIVKLLMPFFSILIRRYVTTTSMYVNNIIEYQTFWDDHVVAKRNDNEDEWSRESFKEMLIFIFHYVRYYKQNPFVESNPDMPDFSKYHNQILSAYRKGDSFSYFVLERLMVIMATCSWEYIRPVINAFFTDAFRQTEWFDYSQMSMLYILFQVSVHAGAANEEIISLFSRECEDWTRRCRGIFKGRNSYKANPTKMYKRNLMNWYCVVYCTHSGDAVVRPGDEKSVPVFYKLLDDAICRKDKELLYHLFENISELVSDFGYIQTTLELLKYILIQFDSVEKIAAFDEIKLERGGIYQDDLVTLVGKVLSTAKHYFSAEVDNFIEKDLIGLKFPGISKYREEILNYNPGGETLIDLLTHKFGNFLMWSLLNEEAIDDFAYEAMSIAVDSPNCFKWFDKVVRLLFRDLFKIKL